MAIGLPESGQSCEMVRGAALTRKENSPEWVRLRPSQKTKIRYKCSSGFTIEEAVSRDEFVLGSTALSSLKYRKSPQKEEIGPQNLV